MGKKAEELSGFPNAGSYLRSVVQTPHMLLHRPWKRKTAAEQGADVQESAHSMKRCMVRAVARSRQRQRGAGLLALPPAWPHSALRALVPAGSRRGKPGCLARPIRHAGGGAAARCWQTTGAAVVSLVRCCAAQGLIDLICLGVGIMLGAGVFVTTGYVAKDIAG